MKRPPYRKEAKKTDAIKKDTDKKRKALERDLERDLKGTEEFGQDRLEGRNPVMEALKAGREIDKILVQKGERAGSIVRIIALAKEKRIVVQEVERQKLDILSSTGVHQGIIAFVAMHQYVEVEDILAKAAEKGEHPFIILVDEITDPHNLGSILRTADAVGAHGVIIPKRRSVGLTAVVAKASAGAIEYVPVARVSNLSQTIDKLKEQGIWVVGADMDGEQTLYEADLKGPIGLVIGSEGEGMGRLVKEKCDFLVRIPMKGEISSLNASVAGAVLMYEVFRQREIGQ
jgi:23S rRNA (guanosine2251-2'-O)-methyltransferase